MPGRYFLVWFWNSNEDGDQSVRGMHSKSCDLPRTAAINII